MNNEDLDRTAFRVRLRNLDYESFLLVISILAFVIFGGGDDAYSKSGRRDSSSTSSTKSTTFTPMSSSSSMSMSSYYTSSTLPLIFLTQHLLLFLLLGQNTAALMLWSAISYNLLFPAHACVLLLSSNPLLIGLWLLHLLFVFRWSLALAFWSAEEHYGNVRKLFQFAIHVAVSAFLANGSSSSSSGSSQLAYLLLWNLALWIWLKLHNFQIQKISWHSWWHSGVIYCKVNGKHLRIGYISSTNE